MDLHLRIKSQISKGNQLALQQLMDLMADDLSIFAQGFVKCKDRAEEIVSDVFYKLWCKRKQIHEIKNLNAYLFVSVRNGALSYLRKKSGLEEIPIESISEFNFPPVRGPESELIDKETLEEINAAIEKLPPKCKMAFMLAKVQGLKYKEISQIMNISVKTINNHIALALEKISDSLETERNKSKETTKKIFSLLFNISL